MNQLAVVEQGETFQQQLHKAHLERRKRLRIVPVQKPIKIPPLIPQKAWEEMRRQEVERAHAGEVAISNCSCQICVNLRLETYRKADVVTIQSILNETAKKYAVDVMDITSPRRNYKILQPRFEVYWRAYKETPRSLPEIGKVCGGKDHTSILHGRNRYDEWQLVKAGKVQRRDGDRFVDFSQIIPLEAVE